MTVNQIAERFAILAAQGFGECDVDVEATVHENVHDLVEERRVKPNGDAVFQNTLQDVYEIEPDAQHGVVSIYARSPKMAAKTPAEVR